MVNKEESYHLARTITILTLLLVIFQVALMFIASYVSGMLDIARAAISTKLFFSAAVYPYFMQFVGAQLLSYVFFIYLTWFLSVSVAELLSVGPLTRYLLGIFIWLDSVIAIITLNVYLVPHSLFTVIIRHYLFNDSLTNAMLWLGLVTSVSIIAAAVIFTAINIIFNLFMMRHLMRTGIILAILIATLFFLQQFYMPQVIRNNENAAYSLPNIFIIGFDAVRPDYLSFYDVNKRPTPHFDEFLRSAVIFENAYTSTARTMPSWMSILTSQYPIHNGIRENNMYLGANYTTETLPMLLQKVGYQTMYATDDRRFNTIDKRVGFNYLIGPPGTIADYLIGSINDFPLSNLIVPTPLGKILFPYSYGNHGSPHTYDPDNFLEQLSRALKSPQDKPLFMAVHFNLSGWPYFWFNDKANYDEDSVAGYINSVPGDDKLLGKFLDLLERKQLLKRAIVVLISDHGMTLALHGDRVISEGLYQGDKTQMKVRRTRYSNAEVVHLEQNQMKQGENITKLILGENLSSVFDLKNYGVDASFGYGADVLSLKQNHSLMAFKGYGFDIGKPHQVYGPSLLLDIAPTLLDLLQLPELKKTDGITLKPYLNSPFLELSHNRPIFFESAYSLTEIEQRNIVVAKILEKSIHFFMLNSKTGSVWLDPDLIKLIIENKQRAILWGDWLLAYYPTSERFKFILDQKNNSYQIAGYQLPPYFVLVNLKTGKWTTEINNPLVINSPFSKLKLAMFQFYGKEMGVYLQKNRG